MVPKEAQKRRKRRNPIERLFLIFLSIAFICVVIGVFSVVFFILFADANYQAPTSEYSEDTSNAKYTKTIRSILSSFPTSGISFDGSRYINTETQLSMMSETITFWVRFRDISVPGRRTVVSTHDNLCSRQDSSSVNGYSLFFEISDNQQIRFHVIYQSRRKDCDDFVVTINESLNRWTHVAVIFNNLECSENASLCKMELSVYVGGMFMDKRIVSHRYRPEASLEPTQLYIGSDIYGVTAFIGDLSAITFFNRALEQSTVSRLSAAKTVSHELLPSVVRIIHPQNGDVLSMSGTEEEVLHLKPVVKEDIETLEKEEKENFATRRFNRRRQAQVSVTSSKDAEKQKHLREEQEVDWHDIAIEDLDTEEEEEEEEEEEVVTKAPAAPIAPEPMPEQVVDLTGRAVVYIDEGNSSKKRIRHNHKEIDIFRNALKKKDTMFLKSGSYHFRIPSGITKDWEELCGQRITQVKDAMKHFWDNYKDFAWGHDELLPLTKAGLDNNGQVGMTLVDSLDTLWIMDMKTEFDLAVDWIAANLDLNSRDEVSVYEYNVRLLGGLLSAYELSKKPVLLEKAIEVGDLILKAFETRSPFPAPYIIPRSGESSKATWKVYLSEVGSLGLELTHLSRVTHNTKYSRVVKSLNDAFGTMETMDGLYPDFFSRLQGHQASKEYSIGESTISFYETMLKGFIQSGATHQGLKSRFDRAIEGIDKWLLRTSYHGGYSYIGTSDGAQFKPTMEQSTCSFAALYALNKFTSPLAKTSNSDERKARALAYTCYQMFKSTPSGLGADRVYFDENHDFLTKSVGTEYKLRSEVIEAFFVLHEITEDPIYVEWGWEIFENMVNRCKTEGGFATYSDVNSSSAELADEAQSFFTAKTLKYFYLLFSPSRLVELQEVLFTNGGHMLPIFEN